MATNPVSEGPTDKDTLTPQNCNACGEVLSSTTPLQKLACGHIFHKACLAKCVKTKPFCPICISRIVTGPPTPSTSQITTRSQSKSALNTSASAIANTRPPNSSPSSNAQRADDAEHNRLQQMVVEIVSAQQEQYHST